MQLHLELLPWWLNLGKCSTPTDWQNATLECSPSLVLPPRTCSAWGPCHCQGSSSTAQHMCVLCFSTRDCAEQKCGCHTPGLHNMTPRPLSGHRLLINDVASESMQDPSTSMLPLLHNNLSQSIWLCFHELLLLGASRCPGKSVSWSPVPLAYSVKLS
jgi:hypothetical protein